MAIKTIAQLKSDVNTNITQNVGTRGITAPILGGEMIDTIDSLSAVDESLEERKANIDGSYDTMTVGLAKNLEGDIYVEGKTYFKPTATVVDDEGAFTSEEVGSGPATIETISGNTVVWNQIVSNNLISGTQTGIGYIEFCQYRFSGGHVFYFTSECSISSDTASLWIACDNASGSYTEPGSAESAGQTLKKLKIFTKIYPHGGYAYFRFGRSGSTSTTKTWTNAQIFDLTQIFGYGNEPSTVEEFEDWLSKNVGLAPYYAYNAGTLINSKPTGIASIGYNLMNLDGTTGTARVPGKYDDGLYGSYYGIRGTYSSVSFIPAATGISESVTPDSDGKFEITRPGDIVVSGAGSSTTVFMWYDGSYTEDSVEYEKNEYSGLDVTKIYGKANGSNTYTQVFPDGIKGIHNVKDILDLKNGTAILNLYRDTVSKSTGFQPWNQNTCYYKPNALTKECKNGLNSTVAVAACEKAGVTKGDVLYVTDRPGLFSIYGRAFYISLSDYNNAAITSYDVIYELKQPITYTDLIVSNDGGQTGTPVQVFNYTVDNWGLEELLPQNDYATANGIVTTAPILNVRYSIDAVEAINTINDQISDLYENKADITGDYPEMSVGFAENLKGRKEETDFYTLRTAGGDAEISNGLAKVTGIGGNNYVYNQLCSTPLNYSIMFNGTLNGSIYDLTTKSIPQYQSMGIGGTATMYHKYYIAIDIYKNELTTTLTINSNPDNMSRDAVGLGAGTVGHIANIITKTYNNSGNFWLLQTVLGMDSGLRFVFSQPIIIDLTLMYGYGNEPDSVSVVEDDLLANVGYAFKYSKGLLLPAVTKELKTVAFNMFDGELEKGYWDAETGEAKETGTGIWIRNKNAISCLPNTDYYLRFNAKTESFGYISFYDESNNFLGSNYTLGFSVGNRVFRTPYKTRFMRFYASNAYTSEDFCFNLSWDGSLDGEYEGYEEHVYNLDVRNFYGSVESEGQPVQIFPDGMRKTPTVQDFIDFNNATADVCVNQVDLSTFDAWFYNDYAFKTQGNNRFPADAKTYPHMEDACGYSCNLIPTGNHSLAYTHKSDVTFQPLQMLFCREYIGVMSVGYEESSAGCSQFVSWLNANHPIMYYELNEPIHYTNVVYRDPDTGTDTPVSVMNINVNNRGTEEQTLTDADLTTGLPTGASAEISTIYGIDAVEHLDTISNEGIDIYSMKTNLESLCTALNTYCSTVLGGTFSVSENPVDKTYTINFTSST